MPLGDGLVPLRNYGLTSYVRGYLANDFFSNFREYELKCFCMGCGGSRGDGGIKICILNIMLPMQINR